MPKTQLQMIWSKGRKPPDARPARGYVLRPFRVEDGRAYCALMAAAGFEGWDAKRLAEWRDKALPNGIFLAEHKRSGTLAATAVAVHRPQPLHPSGGELGWVAARPDHAGKGLGLAVCAAAVRRFLAAGYTRIYLQSDDHRFAAMRVYCRLGFVPFLCAADHAARWKRVFGELGIQFSRHKCVQAPRTRSAASRRNVPWRQAAEQRERQRIFCEELDDFLPKRILDFHAHVAPRGVFPVGQPYRCAGHALAKYDLKDLAADMDAAFPGRKTAAVCFGFPHVEYDRVRNDRYLAEHCDRKRFFPFRLFDPNENDPTAVRADIVAGGFLGLKPYLNYVRKPNPNDVEIREMLPDWIMEIANDIGLIVMLHIPRKERLADPLNQRQLVALCRSWPKAKIVLAHVGRAYFLRNVVGWLDDLKDLPNLWYDLAMVNHWEVMEHLFCTVPSDKVLFASDAPIALAPGKSVEINHQYSYITPVSWKLSIADPDGKIRYTSFLYEELRAIRHAVERLGLGRAFVEGLFYRNGMRLLGRDARG